MTIDSFRKRISPLNLTVSVSNSDKGGEEHWTILGGKSVVHWWPFSRRQTAYCEANHRTYRNCGEEKVLNLINIQPKSNQKISPKQHDLLCPECGNKMILRTDSKFKSHGLWYACGNWPTCQGAHGSHSDGTPLGSPANQETKRWRMRAHTVFDELWKSGGMLRSEAYKFLATELQISLDRCHIGSFSSEQCQKVVEVCEKHGQEKGMIEKKLENSL